PIAARAPISAWLGQPGLAGRRIARRVTFEGQPAAGAIVLLTTRPALDRPQRNRRAALGAAIGDADQQRAQLDQPAPADFARELAPEGAVKGARARGRAPPLARQAHATDAPVAGVGDALDVPAGLHVVDDLERALAGEVQPARQLAQAERLVGQG